MKITRKEQQIIICDLGKKLKNARLGKGWNLEKASEITGYGIAKLNELENVSGRWNSMPLFNLVQLAACFDKIVKIDFCDSE